MKLPRFLNQRFATPLSATLFASSLWLCLPQPAANASTVTIFNSWVDLSNAPGFSTSGVYLAKFGGFASGFQPTLQNLANWDANFSGGTGTYDIATKSPSVQFFNFENSVITVGQPLWLVVYNVAPSAQSSTATTGVVLRMDQWIGGAATVQSDEPNPRGRYPEFDYDYYYWAGGSRSVREGANYDEDNFIGPLDIQNFISPTHTLTLGSGSFVGYDLVITDEINQVVPEPTAALLGGVGFLLLLKRRRVG